MKSDIRRRRIVSLIQAGGFGDGGGAAIPDATPFAIYGIPESTTETFLFWGNTGGVYSLLRNTTNTTVGATEIYSGSNVTFNDSGLTANTTYYYFVSSDGGDNVSTSVTTHAAIPVGWYSIEGAEIGVDNDYAGVVGATASIDEIRNISSGAGPDFPVNGTTYMGMTLISPFSASLVGTIGGAYYTAGSTLTLSGDFCIAFYIEPTTAASTCVLIDSSTNVANAWINSTKAFLQIRIASTNYNLAFASTVPINQYSKIVWKRVGTNSAVSLDGGYTYGANTTVNTNPVVIDRMFASSAAGNNNCRGFRSIVFFDDVLTGDQLKPFFEPFVFPTYTVQSPVTVSPIISGNWNDLTNGSTADSISLQDNGSFAWKTVWSNGDYTFLKATKPSASPTYSDQLLYVYNHLTSKISDPISLPHYLDDTDIHNQQSILVWDNTVFHIGMDQHYSTGHAQSYSKFKIRRFGNNYDLRQYTQSVIEAGIPVYILADRGYFQPTAIGSRIAGLGQLWSGSNVLGVTVTYSDDNLNSWLASQPITVTAGTWTYPILLNNGTLNKFCFIVVELTQSTSKYSSISYLETVDFSTFRNIDNSYSFVYNPNSLVNYTTILTNCAMRTTSGDTVKNVPPGNFMIDSAGFVYGVHGNGENTGWEVTYYNAGWQHVDISFPAAQAVVVPPVAGVGNNFNRVSPLIFKDDSDLTNSTYTVYALCDPSSNGLYRVGKFTTDDLFATEVTFVEYASTDNTRKHWNIQPDFNYHFNDVAMITGTSVNSGSTAAVPWFYKIK